MTNIISPRHIKPRRPVLNMQHPMARGILLAIPFSEQGGILGGFSLIHDHGPLQRHGVSNHLAAGGQWTHGRHGSAYDQLDGQTPDEVIDFGVDSEFAPTAEVTVVCQYLRTDDTDRLSAAFISSVYGADSFMGNIPDSDGTVAWSWGQQLVVGSLTVGDDVWIFTSGPRNQDMWQNGLLRGEQAEVTRTASSENFFVGGGGGQDTDNCRWSLFEMYDRQFTVAEIKQKSEDPWEIWRPKRAVVGFVPEVAAPVFPVELLRVLPRFVAQPLALRSRFPVDFLAVPVVPPFPVELLPAPITRAIPQPFELRPRFPIDLFPAPPLQVELFIPPTARTVPQPLRLRPRFSVVFLEAPSFPVELLALPSARAIPRPFRLRDRSPVELFPAPSFPPELLRLPVIRAIPQPLRLRPRFPVAFLAAPSFPTELLSAPITRAVPQPFRLRPQVFAELFVPVVAPVFPPELLPIVSRFVSRPPALLRPRFPVELFPVLAPPEFPVEILRQPPIRFIPQPLQFAPRLDLSVILPTVAITTCTSGTWSATVSFSPCDSFRIEIDGPSAIDVKVSATMELEEP